MHIDRSEAGDIVALIGVEGIDITDTICDPLDPRPLEVEISTTDGRTLLTTLTNTCWRTVPGVPTVALGVVNAGVGDDGDGVAERTLEQPASVSAAITPAATTPDAGAIF